MPDPVPTEPVIIAKPTMVYKVDWKTVGISVGIVLVLVIALVGGGAWWFLRSIGPSPVPPVPVPIADISLPVTVSTTVGDIATLQAITRGKAVSFQVIAGPDVGRLLQHEPKETHFVAAWPGVYTVSAWTSIKDKPIGPATCSIIVGAAAPPIPPLTPPGPVPPLPVPIPPRPAPIDPFLSALQTAWAQETDADRMTFRQTLIDLYDMASTVDCKNPQLKTAGELQAAMKARLGLLRVDALAKVRDAIAVELRKRLPTVASTPLDDTTRNIASSEFARVAKTLRGLK